MPNYTIKDPAELEIEQPPHSLFPQTQTRPQIIKPAGGLFNVVVKTLKVFKVVMVSKKVVRLLHRNILVHVLRAEEGVE